MAGVGQVEVRVEKKRREGEPPIGSLWIGYDAYTNLPASLGTALKDPFPCPLWLLGKPANKACREFHNTYAYLRQHCGGSSHPSLPEKWKDFYGVDTCVVVCFP